MYRPKKFNPPWVDFFTRPCPYYLKQHTTFPKFPLLPKEIQLLIWSFVEPESRTIYFRSQNPQDFSVSLIRDNPPAILSASYDARYAGLKLYQQVFDSLFLHRSPLILFSFERDTLTIDYNLLEVIGITAMMIPDMMKHLTRVKNLIVNLRGEKLSERHLTKICKYFSGVSVLSIIEGIVQYVTETLGIPHTYFPGENSFRHSWSNIERWIKAPIPFVRSGLSEWKPPVLIIGSMLQWEMSETRIGSRMQLEEDQAKAQRGDMNWKRTVTFPLLEYVPMYQAAESKNQRCSTQ